jgi:hypothetical protein
MTQPAIKVPIRLFAIVEIFAFSLIIIGWNTGAPLLLWAGGALVLGAFFVLAYQILRKSLDKSYPSEGSSTETWRTYH